MTVVADAIVVSGTFDVVAARDVAAAVAGLLFSMLSLLLQLDFQVVSLLLTYPQFTESHSTLSTEGERGHPIGQVRHGFCSGTRSAFGTIPSSSQVRKFKGKNSTRKLVLLALTELSCTVAGGAGGAPDDD
jgi:hypothetical protein